MAGLAKEIDQDGLLEFSVVHTDRALNHMSQRCQGVMRDISGMLKSVHHAPSGVLVPGSGTFGMDAMALQFVTGKKALVVRNGWFNNRWTQIFDMGLEDLHNVDRSVGHLAAALDQLGLPAA